MRVLLCGGGSAGHVNPALAIAETIISNSPSSKVAYVATISGIENDLVEFHKYHINVSGLKRNLISNVKSLYLNLKAIKESKAIINDFCPDIIIGTGGYATYPVIYAGHKLGIPTAVHESNVIPGKAIKMLQNYVDVIFTNFEESKEYFKRKEKVICVGNPLRHGFEYNSKEDLKQKYGIKEKFVILCYGGSLGAEKINEAAVNLIENFIRYNKDVRFIWATGKRNYYDVRRMLENKRLNKLENLNVFEYLYDMPEKMALADLVICRAGAMTISELSALGKASIMIPSPNVANNHQYKNAQTLANIGATKLITEDQLYKIIDVTKEIIFNEKIRKNLEEAIKKINKGNTNKKIYKKIFEIVHNKR